MELLLDTILFFCVTCADCFFEFPLSVQLTPSAISIFWEGVGANVVRHIMIEVYLS